MVCLIQIAFRFKCVWRVQRVVHFYSQNFHCRTECKMANANNIQLKQTNFESGFRPAYYFSRFAGLWPFSIMHHSNGKIHRARVGFFEILRSILAICLNLTLLLDVYIEVKAGREKNTIRIQFVMFNIFKMSSLLFCAIVIMLNMINRNKLIDILGKFTTFDNEVSNFSQIFLVNLNEI